MTSKRTLERRLERIGKGQGHQNLSLCEVLSADDIETVDEKQNLVEIDGTTMRDTLSPALIDRLEDFNDE